ncbi:DUF1501 domain-containing protein [Sedimentisphaera salicampi]|uniref:DUF1501 domain-containing protein n=2 Tax=Sedimentisphaera salicampi TaxID=1941349 RepID=A0A1W6LPR8_9BACT|nr:DUF1501 domain-containing protein [Sedimentisphaera salicampi]ARN57764.1 hypothetical protein STSP1_02187 [Sedimentisphaera salicampi]
MSRFEFTRRDLIKAGAAGLAAPHLLNSQALASKPKAKSVIQIWMWGGPSQIDTFDPKPQAGQDYCGPLDKAIDTNVDGIRINAALPKLAKQADKYSIIRSMTHGTNAHETASYLVQTGRQPTPGIVHPCAGAVVSLFKGRGKGYEKKLPPYIVLTEPQGRFSECGFLGLDYKPFATGGDPAKDPFEVSGIIAKGISEKRQQSRRQLLGRLDTFGKAASNLDIFKLAQNARQEAYDMILGDTKNIFDLSTEKREIRQMYGMNTFGQSCLMARRLAEYGVPYITINYKGWDTHKRHFETMKQKLPELDAGLSTLFADLSDRGLLDSTIVWWGGEFGRGPKVQWQAPWNGGRSHHGKCFSVVVGGGGFQGGKVVGKSDKKAVAVEENPVRPQQLLASMYTLLGIDPSAKMPNNRGLDEIVMPLAKGEGILKEIM